MVNKKDRKHSGRYTPHATCSKKELLTNNLEIPIYYDDWRDHRDSFRDWFSDFKLIKHIPSKSWRYDHDKKRYLMNRKQERLLIRRKARKHKKHSL